MFRNTARRNLFIVYVVVYFLFFDTHFQMPILAPYARSLGATPFLVGLIVGIYSFFNIIGNVISGHIIDSGSLRKPLTIGILGITFSLFTYSLPTSPYHLLAIRAFHGLAGGLVIPATMVYLTKISSTIGKIETASTDGLSKKMAYYGVSIGLAALTGPPIAGLLSASYGYARTYMVVAFLMIIAAVLVIFFVKERKFPVRTKIPLLEYYEKIKTSGLLRIAFKLVFVLMGATGTLASFLPLKAELLGASPALTGGIFAAFAATAILAQLFWPWLVVRFTLSQHVLTGLTLLIAALILVHSSSFILLLFFAMGLYGLGFGLLFPALLELVARGSQPAWKGLATGYFFVFFSLGVAIVPPLSGLLWQSQLAISPFLTVVVAVLVFMLTVTNKQRSAINAKLELIKNK